MTRLRTTRKLACSECNKEFFTNRNDVYTCSNACRQKRYRRRREALKEWKKQQLKLF